MRCPGCNFDNPEDMKFCGNCGVPLCNICPNCGSKNPVQFKFCGNCGVPLTSPQISSELPQHTDNLAVIQKYIPSYLAEKIQQSKGHVEGERKNVTVVFADVSGFTFMAETHDPEEVSSIVTICHTMLGKIVYEYEGVVDKIVGDGLMAIFGVPTHEDDPERAILAAMEMHRGMKDLSREFKESMGISLGLSVGINTGVVVIGDIGTNLRLDYTVMGDVVNTASRVEERSESGEILVTQETYDRTFHCFDFQVMAPARVRGKSQPVRIYKVIKQKEVPLQTRGIEGLRSPLIGREQELAICKRTVDRLMMEKSGVLFITGEAGLGKSRLVKELKEYAESQNLVWLVGKCVSYSRSINYWVFVDAFKNYFDIENKDSATEVECKIRKKKTLIENAGEGIVSTLSSLLLSKSKTEESSDDLAGSEKKLRIFNAVKDVFATESQLSPLVLVLEDLHWIDELSMELLFFLMKELSQRRVTFVCVYRPPISVDLDTCLVQRLEEHYSITKSAVYNRIILNPLSSADSNILLELLLAVEDLPSEMKKLLLDKAGGNPLYLEEVIRSIIDDKTIEHRDGKWLAVKEVGDIEVPGTVQDVIMARIDRLKEEPKHVLQCASVVGRSFDYALLLHLTAEEMVSTLDKHLENLANMGFISREEGNEGVFRFRHVLIHEVAYGIVLIKRRKKLRLM